MDPRPSPVRRPPVTPAQHGYLFGVVYPEILAGLRNNAKQAGEMCPVANERSLHIMLCFLLLEDDEFALPFESLDRSQMADYIDLACAWAADRGINVRAAVQ